MEAPRFLTLTFCALNGFLLGLPQDAAYDLVIATAEGRATKPEIAQALRAHALPAR